VAQLSQLDSEPQKLVAHFELFLIHVAEPVGPPQVLPITERRGSAIVFAGNAERRAWCAKMNKNDQLLLDQKFHMMKNCRIQNIHWLQDKIVG
jgi:hypothetical protein